MDGTERFPRRAEAARATRRRVVAAAAALFEQRGYAATSIVAIAEAADVAEQTVYAAFGNKRTLLAEAVDQAIAGDDEPIAVNDRDWMQPVWNAPDPASRLRAYAAAVVFIHERAARIFRVLEVAAPGTPELDDLW
ncbi:MAG TPA: helix-turn-helix domain-containing protein, partial [Dermatophilaceae bacterium]